MKKFIPLLVVLFSFSYAMCYADSLEKAAEQQSSTGQLSVTTNSEETGIREEYLAEQKVKMLPSKHGKTVDSYMTNMAKIPMAEDLGWKVYAIEDGYEVERSILVNNSKTFRYTWKVSNSGEVTPVNDGARSLMK